MAGPLLEVSPSGLGRGTARGAEAPCTGGRAAGPAPPLPPAAAILLSLAERVSMRLSPHVSLQTQQGPSERLGGTPHPITVCGSSPGYMWRPLSGLEIQHRPLLHQSALSTGPYWSLGVLGSQKPRRESTGQVWTRERVQGPSCRTPSLCLVSPAPETWSGCRARSSLSLWPPLFLDHQLPATLSLPSSLGLMARKIMAQHLDEAQLMLQ